MPGLVQLLCVILGFSTLLLVQVLGKEYGFILACIVVVNYIFLYQFQIHSIRDTGSDIIFFVFLAPHHHGEENEHKKDDVAYCLKILNDTTVLSNKVSILPSTFHSV